MSERPGPRPVLVGYALVAAAATSWGAQSVVAKLLLTSGLAPSSLVSTRTALAALVLVGALGGVRPALLRVRAGDLVHLAILGTVGMALSQYTYYFALTRIPVATALLVTYTSPLLVLTAGVLFYGERLRRRDVAAALATLLGAGLVIRAYEPGTLRGNAAGLAASGFCAAAFAFYSLWAKRTAPRVSPWTMVTYSLLTAAVFWLPLAPPWSVLLGAYAAPIWLGLAVVVVFGTLVPFSLYLAGLSRISAAHASVTATLEPVVAAAVAFVVLGESLAPPQLLGGALIVAGIALLHTQG